MSILTRALVREESATVAKVFVALSLILLGQIFAKLLRKAAEGRIPHDLVAPLVGLGAVKSLAQVLPLALMLGLMLTFGRLYQESEMIAVQAAGVSARQIYKPVWLVTLPTVLLLVFVTFYMSPWSIQMAEGLIYSGQQRADISDVTQGRFIEPKQGNWVIFVERFSAAEDVLKNVFVFKADDDKQVIETATEATQYVDAETGQQMLELREGHRYAGKPGDLDYEIVSFGKHVTRIPPIEELSALNVREAKPTRILLGSSNPVDRAELQWRVSLPIVALIMALMALPLSHTAPRKGRFARLILGIVIYLGYMNLTLLAVSLVETEKIPVWLGVWWVHALMAALALLLVARQFGWSPRRFTTKTWRRR